MKKFYKTAFAEPFPQGGFTLLLDGKPARTPAGHLLRLPNRLLAEAVAAEWQGQGEAIRKDAMPLTQLACVALDLATARRDELMADLLPYAETDLVCYRADDIPALAQQQAELLDPIIAWAEKTFAIQLTTTGGMMPVAQPGANRQKLAGALAAYDDWRFAALAAATGPLGSLILALALVESHIDAKAAFCFSHIEETFQTNKWGKDEEKEARMRKLNTELAGIEKFLSLLVSSPN